MLRSVTLLLPIPLQHHDRSDEALCRAMLCMYYAVSSERLFGRVGAQGSPGPLLSLPLFPCTTSRRARDIGQHIRWRDRLRRPHTDAAAVASAAGHATTPASADNSHTATLTYSAPPDSSPMCSTRTHVPVFDPAFSPPVAESAQSTCHCSSLRPMTTTTTTTKASRSSHPPHRPCRRRRSLHHHRPARSRSPPWRSRRTRLHSPYPAAQASLEPASERGQRRKTW
jgi:hypothetical protein